MSPPLLVIAGPTGVGKTAAAVALARRVPVEIVSADSRQVYRGMDAATGKPTAAELAAARHHLIDVVEPDERYHAARFRHDAAGIVREIRARARLATVVGGTGLYIRALLRGFDPAPPADLAFRGELEAVAASHGRPALHARLAREAPEVAQRVHPNDHVRVIRALELVRAGSPLGTARVRWREAAAEHRVLYVGLSMDRERLWPHLRARARAMAANGLREEVERLVARGHDAALPAMRGIGYRQFVEVVGGRLEADAAVRAMERETVAYARRQLTWFRSEPDVRWIDVEDAGGAEGVASRIHDMLDQEGLIA